MERTKVHLATLARCAPAKVRSVSLNGKRLAAGDQANSIGLLGSPDLGMSAVVQGRPPNALAVFGGLSHRQRRFIPAATSVHNIGGLRMGAYSRCNPLPSLLLRYPSAVAIRCPPANVHWRAWRAWLQLAIDRQGRALAICGDLGRALPCIQGCCLAPGCKERHCSAHAAPFKMAAVGHRSPTVRWRPMAIYPGWYRG
jgi:hypothetical protein